MKILLIKPRWFIKGGVYRFLNNIKFTPLHLGIIAALSDGHDVRVVDGDWDEIPYSEKFDLVGITTATFTSQQVYGIADKFKKAGSKVVLGGVHPSMMPDECLEHADAVVVGEAEYVWKSILQDAERGSLKRVYRSDKIVNMDDVPFPRRELLNEMSWFACLQATRGCPNTCKYCYLPSVPWRTYRQRSIDRVYEELSAMKQKVVFFIDDNLFADVDYAIKLLKKITPLKKIWAIQAPTTIAENEELLKVMAKSGCFNVQMGFQSVDAKSLEWASVKQNRADKYREIVAKLHKYGLLVTGFFMFGFDTDDKDIFARTVEMVKQIDFDDAHLYILMPYPGTELYEQFKRDGRLFEDKDRSSYGWANAVFKPKLMTSEELENGVQEAYEQLRKYFVKRLPGKLLVRSSWLVKHPKLLYTLISGTLGKKDITLK